jgi:hypothetical protein
MEMNPNYDKPGIGCRDMMLLNRGGGGEQMQQQGKDEQ